MNGKPQHRVTTRKPTTAEIRTIKHEAGSHWGERGCAILLFSPPVLGGAVILGVAHDEPWGRVLGAFGLLLGIAIVAAVLVPLNRKLSRQRQSGQRDAAGMQIQRIEVERPRAVQLETTDDHQDPALCLQIGDEALLLLVGQWLRDPAVYGAKPPDGDPLDERLNGLADPHGFPSTAFAIERLVHSGRVLRIVVSGSYLDPERVSGGLLTADDEFGDSKLIEGRLDAVGEALAAARSRNSSRLHLRAG